MSFSQNHVTIVDSLIHEADKYRKLYHPKALDIAREALEIAKKHNLKDKEARCKRTLGAIHYYLSDSPSKAFSYFFDAYYIYTELKDTKQQVITLFNIASYYQQLKNDSLSIKYYNKCMEMMNVLDDKGMLSSLYNNLGMLEIDRGNYNNAISLLNKSVDLKKELNDSVNIHGVYTNLGLAHNGLADYKTASLYYLKAISFYKANNSIYPLVTVYISYSELLRATGKLKAAEEYGLMALKFSKENNLTQLKKESYHNLYFIYKEKRLFEKALDNYLVYDSLKYEIIESHNQQEMKKLRAKLDYNLLQQKLKIGEQKLKYQADKQTYLYAIIASISALLIISVVFYLQKRKANKSLKRLNEEIKSQSDEILHQNEEIKTQSEELQRINKELEKLSTVADKTDNAITIMDKTGKFEWVNNAFTNLYGYDIDSLVKDRGNTIFQASLNHNTKNEIRNCIINRKTVSYESSNKSASGESIWAQTTVTPILDNNGNVEKLIAIDSDITKLKIAEKGLQQKNRQIIDSIQYAQKIQKGLLPDLDKLKQVLPKVSLFFKPREIVSGDFYWFSCSKEHIYLAVSDCTGHGVPGAFMSLIGITLLNEIINEKDNYSPGEILTKLNKGILQALNASGKKNENDGMDISMIKIDFNTFCIEYALSNHIAYHISNNNIKALEGDIFSIGGMFACKPEESFNNHTAKMKKNDVFVMTTDGFQDQFGGSENKKFMVSRLKKLLLEAAMIDAAKRREYIEKEFYKWKGKNRQIDDVLLMCIEV